MLSVPIASAGNGLHGESTAFPNHISHPKTFDKKRLTRDFDPGKIATIKLFLNGSIIFYIFIGHQMKQIIEVVKLPLKKQ
jgi:hypothetical protein